MGDEFSKRVVRGGSKVVSSHDHAEAMRQQKVRATRNYKWEKICESGLGRKATAVEGRKRSLVTMDTRTEKQS